MEVIKFIKEHGVDQLTEQLGIKVKEYPEHGVVVLNYCQIDSPKTHPVVRECRGLILDVESLEVFCRPFQRFYNYGEAPETTEGFDLSRAVAYDKVDGSLIKVWYHPVLGWQCATRGTAFAESDVNGWDLTFADLVHQALDCADHEEFQAKCNRNLSTTHTYLYEITSRENRVVTSYEGTKLWYLGCVSTWLGLDKTMAKGVACKKDGALGIGAHEIGQRGFESIDDCLSTAASLPDLQEGYVLYDCKSGVRIKVKSPAYVAVHHIRGEGLNPKRIKQLVLTNEQDEYLKYFPEDREHIEPVVWQLKQMIGRMHMNYSVHCYTEDQKEFALVITKNVPKPDQVYSSVLFKARAKKITTKEAWSQLDANQQYKMFTNYLDRA